MKNNLLKNIGMLLGLNIFLNNAYAGVLCSPDASTSFTDFTDRVYRITNDTMGNNRLYSQCSNLTNEIFLSEMNSCFPAPINPMNGLGLNPTDKLLYALSPTDVLGIGTHLELNLPFPSPGQPGDIMKADNVNLYRIGNDGGFENIGFVVPPTESPGLPSGTDQVVPIIHSASSFNQAGDLFVLAYRTNYTTTSDIMSGDAEVLYHTPNIVIGQINNNDLVSANGAEIVTSWTDINVTSDNTCNNVVNKFKDDTNEFSVCVVDQFFKTGNEDFAVQHCLIQVPIIDKGIHDFAVSPINGHFYGYDSMTYDDRDVLVDMDPITKTATCTEYPDIGNQTRVLTSLMFSSQNKLVAIFANQNTGNWININNGTINHIPQTVSNSAFGDGSSIPFADITRSSQGTSDLIFKNDFELPIILIFANSFEGNPEPAICPSF